VSSWSAPSTVAGNMELQLTAHNGWLSSCQIFANCDIALHIGTQFVKLAVCLPGMVPSREKVV
jgi:hypothetical protein